MTTKTEKVPRSITYKGVKYTLFDQQWSEKNAETSAQLYASIGPKNAKYVIQEFKINGESKWGVYTSAKVVVGRAKKVK
jgi:hypothetical protein